MPSIKIYVNEVHNGWTPWDSFLRGTEEYVREFATVATEMGHEVTVYHNGDQHGEYMGANYLPHGVFDNTADILLIVKEASLLDRDLRARRILYFTNDIDDEARLTPERLAKVEKVIAISKFHQDTYLAKTPKVQVIPHGCYLERYKDPRTNDYYAKKPYLCLYASSHDRGLDKLEEFWPQIKAKVPQAQLVVTYDGTTEEEMDELYRRAEFWLYPCHGVELFCITGLKAQAAGMVPIVVPHMALTETVKVGIKTSMEAFTDETVTALRYRGMAIRSTQKRLKHIKLPHHRDVVTQTLA